MMFHNPWGLLALLAVPLIIYLHFFRDRRQVRRIGGLHLWQFAEIRLPAGRHFQRINNNLSLIFQILGAILLSLLIAGFDIPRQSNTRHYTILLDDSASMQAGNGESSADRARKSLIQWAGVKDKFTVIAAGERPRILAGPFAGRDELIKTLEQWMPESPSLDLESAVNLASKFLTGSEKILVITDDPGPAKPYMRNMIIHSVGTPLDNAAIDFADRVRLAPQRDKVFVTLRSFARTERNVTIEAKVSDQSLFSKVVSLSSDRPANLAFETSDTRNPIRIRIGDDSLNADNTIELAPVTVKPVHVAFDGMGDSLEYFSRAVRAVPNAEIVTPLQADLVFTEHASLQPVPRNMRMYAFPPLMDNPTSLALAQGEQLVVSQGSLLTRGLGFEGVLWAYQSEGKPPLETNTTNSVTMSKGLSPLAALVSVGQEPLVYLQSVGANDARRYRINLLRDRSNIFRNAAWPILMQNIVEECRQALPGMTRTNYRAGEAITLRLRPEDRKSGPYLLNRNNQMLAKYDEAPEVWQGLAPGRYRLLDAKQKDLADFSVNLLATAESDLRKLKTQKADLQQLQAASFGPIEQNRLLFFLLLLGILIFTAASWVFQDMSR